MSRETRVNGIRRWLNLPPSSRTLQRDVDDEIRFHIETRVAELVAGGTSPELARDIAAREFGDVTEARAELARVDRRRLTRERRASWWETLGQDIAYSTRSLRTQPGFAAVVVAVLALGIGANVTMFGVIDRLLLRPPAHVTDPARLVSVAMGQTRDGEESLQRVLSYPVYQDLRFARQAFQHVAVYSPASMTIGRGREARELSGMRVSANYFAALGVRPTAGRFFLPEEDGDPIAPAVAVLGHGFWQRHFQGARTAIGGTLAVGNVTYTIVGVAPDGFIGVGNSPVDVWVPLTADLTPIQHQGWLSSRQAYWLRIVGRVRDGMSIEQASTIATAALRAGALRDGVPQAHIAATAPTARLVSVLPREARAHTADAKVAVLLGAVSILVLLIACANVANLQLARAVARQREVAVRIALGIERARLVRQLVLETVVLGLAAGAAASVVAIWGSGIVRRVITSDPTMHTPLDARSVVYTVLAAVAAGIVSGIIPAVQGSRPEVADALRAGTRAGGPARSRTRGALLIVQAALSVVFLIGTTLFVRSLQQVRSLPLGMDLRRALYVSARTTGLDYDAATRDALYRRLMDAARAAPGVEGAALGVGLPFATTWAEEVTVPGRDSMPLTRSGGPYFNAVTGDFFRTMGMRILRGRGLTAADRGGAAPVVVVNETLANLWWPNEEAIGHCMKVGGDTMPCAQIVGVAENARRQSLIEDPSVQFFIPLEQAPVWADSRVLFVRTTGDAAKASESLRRALQARVPDAPYLEVSTMETLVNPQTRSWRLGATMFGLFGALAVVVAALGLYSVLAYDVSRRTRELGIRVALGARRVDVVRMVVVRALKVVAFGLAAGSAIAIAAGPALTPLLYRTSAREPMAFAFAAAVLLVVAGLAAVLPARRAVRVDPMVALRSD
ncbi:MAG: permease [Geminicoccaceae bacterium]|nr:permease [Geminicoccaceae bacterium]